MRKFLVLGLEGSEEEESSSSSVWNGGGRRRRGEMLVLFLFVSFLFRFILCVR